MWQHRRDERGESLIEIIVALVVIGAVVSAFFAMYATASTASTAHRDLVTADAVLRDYAESTKQAARDCVPSGSYSVTYGSPADPLPADFSVSPPPATNTPCPEPESPQEVALQVTLPSGQTKDLTIVVRAP